MTHFARYDIPPGGAFWCRIDMVDATPADIQANDADALPAERRLLIRQAIELQLGRLVFTPPKGTC